MAIPIATSRVIPYKLPVHVPFAIATQTLSYAEGAYIELVNDRGQVGLGEGAPFPALTKDNVHTCVSHARELVSAVQNHTPQEALLYLTSIKKESMGYSRTAFVGVESAVWDLLAKEQGLPLAKLWGSASLTTLTTDITLPIMPPEQVAAFWRKFADYEFPIVKIKVSGHVASDLDLVVETSRLIGPSVAITLDGNQGYDLPNARVFVERLIQLGLTPLFFEQPLPADDAHGLASLTANLPIPVCVDETVETADDARRVARDRLAHIINLKIMKSSIAETLAILDVAKQSNLQLMIGGMLETEVAMGISLQLACGSGAITHVDLDTPFFMTRPSTEESPWHPRSARLLCPQSPGHGLVLQADLTISG
jgi:L-alanine-DL-glutamate epimerase-like enolase superfamily enzyme